MDERSLKILREVSSSMRNRVEKCGETVHFWRFSDTNFSTEKLKKFADDVKTVLGNNLE